mgnify:FL=1
MYTIMVKPDHSLHATTKQRIMHRSSLINKLHFLVSPTYEDVDMRKFVCSLEYRLPISKELVHEILTPSENLYGNYVEFLLPVTTKITSEPGDVSLKLTFTYLEMDDSGNYLEHIRPTDSIDLPITPVDRWGDYIPDAKLDPIVQAMLYIQAQNEQLKDYSEAIQTTKADNLTYNDKTNELQLQANGQPIGNPVILEECVSEDGVPSVDFTTIEKNDDGKVDNVVEF